MVKYGKGYTEEEIIRGCIANDRRCQEFLYRAHFDVMMAMIRRFTQDDETALHILNNGFLRVFRKMDKYSGKGSFQGWIRRIVYHSVSDHFRKESNYLHFIVLDDAEKNTRTGPLENLYYEDLIKLINALPSKRGEVFRLYAIEGYSHKEIGEMLEMSEGTSKWHLSKAREELRENILSQKNRQHAG
jgi:RNA polymerase sigma-70 factor (ECF subfamily)